METLVPGAVAFRGAPPRPAEGFTPQQTQQLFEASPDMPPPSKGVGPAPPKRLLLLVAGFIILLLAVIMPVWDALLLLREPTYRLVFGKTWAIWTLVSCFSAAPIYAIMLIVWFKCSRVEFITEQTLLMIFVLVTSALGLSLLFASQPLLNNANVVYDTMFFNCQNAAYTQGIYNHAVALHKLRADPTCAAKNSVEECSGFKDTYPEYTNYLRTLEHRFKCVGFCTTTDPVTFTRNGTEAPLAVVEPDSSEVVTTTGALVQTDSEATTLYEGRFPNAEKMVASWVLGDDQMACVVTKTADGTQLQLSMELNGGTGAMVSGVLEMQGEWLETQLMVNGASLALVRIGKFTSDPDTMVAQMKAFGVTQWGQELQAHKAALLYEGKFPNAEKMIANWHLGDDGMECVVARTDDGTHLQFGMQLNGGDGATVSGVLEMEGDWLETELVFNGMRIAIVRIGKFTSDPDAMIAQMKASPTAKWGQELIGSKEKAKFLADWLPLLVKLEVTPLEVLQRAMTPVTPPQSLLQTDHATRGELATHLKMVFGAKPARLQRRTQQALRSTLVSDAGDGLSKVGAEAEVARERAGESRASPGAIRTDPVPALFYPASMVSNPSSCDGAAARTMKYSVTATAKLLFIEGIALLIASVAGALLKVFGFIAEGYADERYIINNPAKLRQAREVML
mmetsp:Transcript_131/g.296  ORF Transcript_131/g.296 Transcript_131/m.296 type:complete len:680 (-) Transcript_131:2-2041(-)